MALELLARLDQVDGEGQIGSGGVEVQRRDLTP
jgi:hypothetical protein